MAYRLRPWNPSSMSAWLAAYAAVGVLGFGIWGFSTQVVGMHVTECGFDSKGAYAKVRVNNLLGGALKQDVHVWFHMNDVPYDVTFASVQVPAHGRGTAVLQGGFPPHDLTDADGHHLNVQGRTVYVLGTTNDNPRIVTKKVAFTNHRTSKHLGGLRIETVPDDPNSMSCSVETGD